MPNKLKLETKSEPFSDIFSNGKRYIVPRFQRDYSWELENWQDLWEDVKALSGNSDDCHYMGYLVFQEMETMKFKVIDGQQRLTTFSLLTLAAIKRLKEMDGERARADELFKNFIGSKHLVSLERENKLVLNRNNDYYYREVVDGNDPPGRKKKTVRQMREAQDYFYEQFRKYSEGAEISRVIQQIAQRMLFTVIYIGDELNAYKVFETLNARGVKLSSADLLKNYLFSLIDPSNNVPNEILDRLDDKWEKIGEDIGNRDYAEYILVQWNSNHHPLTRKANLFKNIKKEINNKKKADAFLTDLANNSKLYSALFDGSDDFWREHGAHISIEKDLKFLSLFGIRQPHSLLMASYDKFRKDFGKILNWIKIFSLRYNVICGEHLGDQEKCYSQICDKILKGCDLQDIKEAILKKFPPDDQFKADFTVKAMPTQRSNKKACYLLARLEEYKDRSKRIDEVSLTVEHILPLNPDNSWMEYFGGNWESFNQRLGNMALVDSNTNLEMGQEKFENKKKILSKYQINSGIGKYSEWNSDSVESRQKEMAEEAAKLWRID